VLHRMAQSPQGLRGHIGTYGVPGSCYASPDSPPEGPSQGPSRDTPKGPHLGPPNRSFQGYPQVRPLRSMDLGSGPDGQILRSWVSTQIQSYRPDPETSRWGVPQISGHEVPWDPPDPGICLSRRRTRVLHTFWGVVFHSSTDGPCMGPVEGYG